MESQGEVQRSVLRLGGLAGILAGVILIVILGIVLGIASFATLSFPPNRVEILERFPEFATLWSAALSLFVVYGLLLLPFFAALYLSLREPNRVYARIGLGSGILAIILMVSITQLNLQSLHTFSAVLADPSADRAMVIATYASVASLVNALDALTWLFTGFTFVAFGIAMRASPSYSQGLVWLTVILGLLTVASAFLIPPAGLGIFFTPVLYLVLGWKVYRLSRTSPPG